MKQEPLNGLHPAYILHPYCIPNPSQKKKSEMWLCTDHAEGHFADRNNDEQTHLCASESRSLQTK